MLLIDILILLPVVYGLVRGLMRGLVQELTAIVALIAAWLCARQWAPALSVQLTEYVTWDASICQAVSYLALFFVIALGLNLAGRLFSRLLRAIQLGGINRLLGGLFGALKWLLLVSVVLNGIDLLDNHFHFIKPEQKEESFAYEPVKQIATIAWTEIKGGEE